MSNMSRKSPNPPENNHNHNDNDNHHRKLFNIDKESRKFYPRSEPHFSLNSGIPLYKRVRIPKSGIFSRGIYTTIFTAM